MKAICLCTSNRPELVKQCLESLHQNKLEGWTLFASCEPDCPAVHKLIEAVDFMPKIWWVNGTRLGPELNTFTVCFKAIDSDAKAILYFDDDMVLSPDAVEMCDWYLSNDWMTEPTKNGGICLCTKESDPSRPESISPADTWKGLVGQGYCYTRQQWKHFVKRNFWVHKTHFGGDGYDWALGHSAVDLEKRIYRPRLSRSRHIGTHGHHPNGEIFPEHISTHRDLKFVIEPT